jgi:hypothetical protein
MSDFPSHPVPTYNELSQHDALFHYTTAAGLIGIFTSGEIWSTAHYCTNDERELSTGRGVLSSIFRKANSKLIRENDPRVGILARRGISINEHQDEFEGLIIAMIFNSLGAYVTCMCRPRGDEDFQHGLLSQWRGYGVDGGYALHFSRAKLDEEIKRVANSEGTYYNLQNVHYALENPLKAKVLDHSDAFLKAYMAHIDWLVQPIGSTKTFHSPLPELVNGPLEALLDYLIHTKNQHFAEERECRLTVMQPVPGTETCLPVGYFNRSGLIVPYTQTPRDAFNLLNCVEWIVVGPGPRQTARFKSVTQMIRQHGRNILVRASHIPFTRA